MRSLLALPLIVLLAACGSEAVEAEPTPKPSPISVEATPAVEFDEVGSRISLDEAHTYAAEHGYTDTTEAFDRAALDLCDVMWNVGAAQGLQLTAAGAGMTDEQAPILGAMAVYACPSLADEAYGGRAELG